MVQEERYIFWVGDGTEFRFERMRRKGWLRGVTVHDSCMTKGQKGSIILICCKGEDTLPGYEL